MFYIATLWLVNDKGELLLARRSDTKKHDPGLWAPSVTGKREKGETVEEALLREAEEELGIKSHLYEPIFLFEEDFAHPDGEVRRFSIFAAKASDKLTDQINIDNDEVADIKWVTPTELRALLKTNPGEIIPASGFELWGNVLKMLQEKEML